MVVMAAGIWMGIGVLIAGLLFAFGLMGADGTKPVLIGLGLLLMGLCAIFGVQPGFPGRRSQ